MVMTTEYYSQRVPPKREDRLKPCIAYGGPACGAGRNGRMRCLDMGERTFSQGSICLLLPALGTLASLPNTAVLLHGAVGCGSSIHGGTAAVRVGSNARFGSPKDALWFSTALNETDVISGGEPKLERAIREIDEHYNVSAVVVVSGCVPGVTGDDIDGVVDRVQPQVRAKLLPIHCEGFKTKIMATAYDAFYHSFGRHLLDVSGDAAEPAIADWRLRGKPVVNVMNVSSMGRVDELELERLLNAIGLNVNFYPVFSRPLDMHRATKAALSVSTCPTHDDYFLRFLQDKYGVPYVLRHMPIGIANTGAWLRQIAEFFKIQDLAEQTIAAEEADLAAALAPLLPLFAGKRAFVTAGEFRALATATLLRELGFELAAVRPYHVDEFADVEFRKLTAQGTKDFTLNVANCQPFEEANLLNRLKPDVFLGHLNANGTAAKLGIVTQVIYNAGQHCLGYRGVFEQARRLHRHLRNPSFNRRIASRASLPYRASWFESEPFVHIKTAEGTDRD
jgi:nitrogenase molybdenum-iron protein alpha chain